MRAKNKEMTVLRHFWWKILHWAFLFIMLLPTLYQIQ